MKNKAIFYLIMWQAVKITLAMFVGALGVEKVETLFIENAISYMHVHIGMGM